MVWFGCVVVIVMVRKRGKVMHHVNPCECPQKDIKSNVCV